MSFWSLFLDVGFKLHRKFLLKTIVQLHCFIEHITIPTVFILELTDQLNKLR
jgi:hypothetical protein